MKIAVIGAGLSGLTVAYYLTQFSSSEVTLFEADRIGGRNKTEKYEGNILESRDDHVYLKNPLFLNLCKDLNLDITFARKEIQKKIISKDAQFFYAPPDIYNLKKTPMIFFSEKFKISRSFKKKYSFWTSISVYEAFKSVFGQTAADYIASPLIRYLFFSEAEDVELSSAFPGLFKKLQTSNNIISALQNAEKEEKEYWHQKVNTDEYDKSKIQYLTLDQGFDKLIISLTEHLKGSKASFKSMKVQSFKQQHNKYFLQNKMDNSGAFDRIIFCIPPAELVKIVKDTDKELKQHLQDAPKSRVTCIYHGWPKNKFKITGYGVFCPRAEKQSFLFSLFLSNLYPDKFEEETFTTKTYVSGDNEIFSDEDMAMMSLGSLKRILKIKTEPLWDVVYRSKDFIKMKPGHREWQLKLQDILKSYENVFIHPSSLYLDSWGDLLERSFHLAEEAGV